MYLGHHDVYASVLHQYWNNKMEHIGSIPFSVQKTRILSSLPLRTGLEAQSLVT